MENKSTNQNETPEIQVILKRNNNWYLYTKSSSKILLPQDLIEDILQQFKQLVFINSSTIINIDLINTSLSNISKEYVVINGHIYIISKKYMPAIKALLIEQHPNIFNSINVYTKGSYLNRINNKVTFEINDIKYLIRKSTQTVVFLKNGTKKYFYEPLKYFENNVLQNNNFIKVRRDCIVNINFLSNLSIDKKKKTGEVYIESEILHISRRNLQAFKKYKLNSIHV